MNKFQELARQYHEGLITEQETLNKIMDLLVEDNYANANIEAVKELCLLLDPKPALPDGCTCKFVAIGKPLSSEGCKLHAKNAYKCDACSCDDYKPNSIPIFNSEGSITTWPRCTCGHVAQEHN